MTEEALKLIVKDDCGKCEFVKEKIGNKVEEIQIINEDSIDGKVLMSYYEIFLIMDSNPNANFPFLITPDEQVIHGAIKIKNHILGKVE